MSEAARGFSVVNRVRITVSNLDESVRFYEALTGTEITDRDEIGGKRTAQTQRLDDTLIKYTNVHLENISIDLLEYVKPKSEKASYSNEQISAMHPCFEAEDIDAAVARLRVIGVEPDGEPITSQGEDGLKSGFGTDVAYFTDPDDTDLESVAPKDPFTRN